MQDAMGNKCTQSFEEKWRCWPKLSCRATFSTTWEQLSLVRSSAKRAHRLAVRNHSRFAFYSQLLSLLIDTSDKFPHSFRRLRRIVNYAFFLTILKAFAIINRELMAMCANAWIVDRRRRRREGGRCFRRMNGSSQVHRCNLQRQQMFIHFSPSSIPLNSFGCVSKKKPDATQHRN